MSCFGNWLQNKIVQTIIKSHTLLHFWRPIDYLPTDSDRLLKGSLFIAFSVHCRVLELVKLARPHSRSFCRDAWQISRFAFIASWTSMSIVFMRPSRVDDWTFYMDSHGFT